MKHLKSLIAIAVGLAPALASADNLKFRCGAPHFIRIAGLATPESGGVAPTELRLTVITFSNADLQNAATIERMTWRDADGVVRHDSGPKIRVPHPFTLGRDITRVPPGGSYNTSTTSLGSPPWFLNHPSFAPPPSELEGLFVTNGSLTVEVSTRGPARLFTVYARETDRALVFDQMNNRISMGEERTSQSTSCVRISDRDDD